MYNRTLTMTEVLIWIMFPVDTMVCDKETACGPTLVKDRVTSLI